MEGATSAVQYIHVKLHHSSDIKVPLEKRACRDRVGLAPRWPGWKARMQAAGASFSSCQKSLGAVLVVIKQ